VVLRAPAPRRWSPRWIAAVLALAFAAGTAGPASAQAWKPRKKHHPAPRKAPPPPSPKQHPHHGPHHAKKKKPAPKKKAPRRAVIIEEDAAFRGVTIDGGQLKACTKLPLVGNKCVKV
jgi:hypothetical protein